MRARDRLAPLEVDLGVRELAGRDLAGDDPSLVHDQTRQRLLDVVDLDQRAVELSRIRPWSASWPPPSA